MASNRNDNPVNRRLTAEAADLRMRLDANRDVLGGILGSNIWQTTAWLRRLKYRLGVLKGRLSGDRVGVILDCPSDGDRIERKLHISGSVESDKPIAWIEVLLDYVVLTQVDPRRRDGSTRVAESGKSNFDFSVTVDSVFAGQRRLNVRIRDLDGGIAEIERRITVAGHAPAPQLDLAEQRLMFVRSAGEKRNHLQLELFLANGSEIVLTPPRDPVVSVVLVLYNRAELTLKCLRSLLAHDYRSFEVIIVDNDSRDATGELLARVSGAKIIRNTENLHFLRACNAAAAQAEGRHLLFLNNDAELCLGAVAAAVETIGAAKDIGAVGGRIILPDGSLQEAGSIVWSDGSTTGYGRSEDPLDLRFAFRRDVDFCSGAFLMTPRAVFESLGGFDEAFAPAYYEETDYCTRLWKRGYRVVYEPRCSIVHYESGSSSHRAEVDALVRRNMKLFAQRHAEWLNDQPVDGHIPDRIAAERPLRGASRILVIDSQLPRRVAGAGYPRMVEILGMFRALGARVTFFPLLKPAKPQPDTYREIPAETEICEGGSEDRLIALLSEREGWFDILWLSRAENLALVNPLLRDRPDLFTGMRLIYDSEAVFALRDIRRAQAEGDSITDAAADEMISSEIKPALELDTVIAVSQAEADEFRIRGAARVELFSHPVAASPTEAPFSQRAGFLFVGALYNSESPNAHSLRWFIRNVWPAVRSELAASTIQIVGIVDESVRLELAAEGVEFCGVVDDLRPVFDATRVFIAPTQFAAGIPLKVIEAAAMGLPVVCTPLLAEQLGWTDEVLTAGSAPDFATACIGIHENLGRWQEQRERALDRVRRDHDPAAMREQLREIIAG